MIKIQKFTPNVQMSESLKNEVLQFLFASLEQYGDPKEDINKAMEYACNKDKGGIIVIALSEEKVVGAVVVNETGMGGYIPENILVYIATHPSQRGKGIGKQLMKETLESCKGDVALHVEPDNPAKKLYENLGFTNKYLEMRYKKTV